MVTPIFGGLRIPAAGTLNGASAGADARQLPAAGERSLIPVVYGDDRIGGLLLNVLPVSSGVTAGWLMMQVLWCHACTSITSLRLNGNALPSEAVVIHYLGSQVTANADMVVSMAAQGITYADALTGFAYSVIQMPMRRFDGRLDFTALIGGRAVYDPRLDSTVPGGSGSQRLATPSTWAKSYNPVVNLADFLASTVYGAGMPVVWVQESIPSAPGFAGATDTTKSVFANANICDELIGSPAEPRRQLNGLTLSAAASVLEVAEVLRAHAGVWLVQTANGIGMVPDVIGASVAASYDHDLGDFAAVESVQVPDLGDAPTVVEVIYTDARQVPWRDAIARAALPGVGSTLPERLSQVRMPGIQRHSEAYREAYQRLYTLNQNGATTTVELFEPGILREPGDVVGITHPIGFAAAEMRVVGVGLAGIGRWRLALRAHTDDVYSEDVVAAPSLGQTGLDMGDLRTPRIYRQTATPTGDLIENDVWIDTDDGDRMYVRKSGVWEPILFGTSALASRAVSRTLADNATYAPLNINGALGNQLVRSWVMTPEVACDLYLGIEVDAARVQNDSGYTLFVRITPAGGSAVVVWTAASSSLDAPPPRTFAGEALYAAAGGVALTIEIMASVYLGAPTPMVIYASRLRTLELKR